METLSYATPEPPPTHNVCAMLTLFCAGAVASFALLILLIEWKLRGVRDRDVSALWLWVALVALEGFFVARDRAVRIKPAALPLAFFVGLTSACVPFLVWYALQWFSGQGHYAGWP